MKGSRFTKSLSMMLVLIQVLLLMGGNAQTVSADSSTPTPQAPQTGPYAMYLPVVSANRPVLTGYFVSPSGNDANPGTETLPWKTIGKAAGRVLPGDKVYLRGGTYVEYVSVNRSGTQAQPIQFMAYPGETPVLDGQNVLPNSADGLFTIDGNWVELSGIEVKNSTYMGVALYGYHNTVTNVFVHHSYRNGIYINGDYNTVQDSRVWRNSMHSEFGKEIGSSGIAASFNEFGDRITDYPIIRRNIVWENWGQGIDVHHVNYALIEDNITHDNYTNNLYIHDLTNALAQRNLVYMDMTNTYMANYGDKVGILMGEEYSPPIAKNIQVINNIVYGNHRNLFWYTGNLGSGMENVLIANNTFVNGTGVSAGNSNIILDPADNTIGHINVRFENNLVVQDDSLPLISVDDPTGITFTHNLWSRAVTSRATGVGDVIGNPLLSRSGSPFSPDWYRLTASSPAINKALLLGEVSADYFTVQRGSLPDIGAAEFH